MTNKNLYDILELDKNSSIDDVKKQFKKLTKKYHPDINKSPDAESKYKEIVSAYEVLSDEHKKEMYDNYGTTDDNPNVGTNFGGFNINDLFGQMGGFGFRSGFNQRESNNGPMPMDGSDIRVSYNVSLYDVFKGKNNITVKYKRHINCVRCNGTGSKSGHKHMCDMCNGTGFRVITQQKGNMIIQNQTICDNCNGTGFANNTDDKCIECNGKGSKEIIETLVFNITAGNYHPIIINNKGNEGVNGGHNGNLVIILNIQPYENIHKVNLNCADVVMDLNLKYEQLVLGDEIVIKTLHGDKKITINPNTYPETDLVYSELGLPIIDRTYDNKDVKYGNMILNIHMKYPTELNDKEKKHLEAIKNLYKPKKTKKKKE